jgi:hypothetical protein
MAEEELSPSGKPELDAFMQRVEHYGIDKESEKIRETTPEQVREQARFEHAAQDFIRAFNELAQIIHEDNVKKGFWPDGGRELLPVLGEGREELVDTPGCRNVGEMLMLAVSELGEGLEAYRKDLNDDHLPQYKGLEVEIADCIIRLMDTGYGLCLPVAEALVDKLVYNRSRPFKHGKKF